VGVPALRAVRLYAQAHGAASLLRYLGDFSGAIEQYKLAANSPNKFGGYQGLAEVYGLMGKTNEAAALAEASRIDSKLTINWLIGVGVNWFITASGYAAP